MAKANQYSYTFANAYIASISRNLMSKQDLLRVASAKDFQTIEAMMGDFGYGEIAELKQGNIEAFIRREQNKLFEDIYGTLKDRTDLALWLVPFDYHNVKVCIKSEMLNMIPNENHLISSGNIDPKQIKAMIHDRNYIFMSDIMKNAIENAIDVYSRSRDSQEIDLVLDRACYQEMSQNAKEMDEPFLQMMVQAQVDIRNLKTFVRIKYMGKNVDFFKKAFLDGGSVPMELYTSSFDDSYGAIADKLSPYGLKQAMSEGGSRVKEKGDFSALEKLCTEYVIKLNRNARYQTFGIPPIAWYWYAKSVELDNLRVILLGKKNKYGCRGDYGKVV